MKDNNEKQDNTKKFFRVENWKTILMIFSTINVALLLILGYSKLVVTYDDVSSVSDLMLIHGIISAVSFGTVVWCDEY